MATKKSNTKSPIQKQIEALEKKAGILDLITGIAKTSGGHISDDGKNLYHILKTAGLKKSEIAAVLDVTPAALTPYE